MWPAWDHLTNNGKDRIWTHFQLSPTLNSNTVAPLWRPRSLLSGTEGQQPAIWRIVHVGMTHLSLCILRSCFQSSGDLSHQNPLKENDLDYLTENWARSLGVCIQNHLCHSLGVWSISITSPNFLIVNKKIEFFQSLQINSTVIKNLSPQPSRKY